MEIECSLNMYEPNTQRVFNTTTLTICVFITQRYQLKIQPSQDVKIVLEDAISPRLCFHLKVPLSVVTAGGLPLLRQNYVLKELYKLNFDPTVSQYLKERIESWVLGEVEKNGCKFNEGCEVVAELKVFKAESVMVKKSLITFLAKFLARKVLICCIGIHHICDSLMILYKTMMISMWCIFFLFHFCFYFLNIFLTWCVNNLVWDKFYRYFYSFFLILWYNESSLEI